MKTSRRPRYAVLISGRGSNLRAILEANLDADCAGVISSRSNASGLEIAHAHDVPTATLVNRSFADRAAFDEALDEALEHWNVDWVVLAGFMRILTDGFVRKWQGKLVNIHPSLLPDFPGLHPHQQALDAGVDTTGCTVHLVEPGDVDGGRVLAQASVPVHDGDTADRLADRVLHAEHQLYPETLGRLFAGDLPMPHPP